MKMLTLARRTSKEILRDPVNLGFGLGFPVVLLLLLTAIQANIPVSLFEVDRLTPGIAVFGLSFLALFSATLVAKDRGSALLSRLYTAPLSPLDFILSYTLPLLPMALGQALFLYLIALPLGLSPTWSMIPAILSVLPTAVFFIALGLLCGSLLGDKQVGGICGAMLTNLTAFLSGIWFDLSLVGGAFETVAGLLPFSHAVELSRAMLGGDYGRSLPHLLWVSGYALVTLTLAVCFFLRQKKRQ